MRKTVNLISHLPPFMAEYDEMQKIMSAENPEFQLLVDKTESTLADSFILYASIDGIRRYEKILGITPEPLDTLQTRRLRILAEWNNLPPYTYRALQLKLKTICGEKEFKTTPFFDEYKLILTLYDVETEIVKAVRRLGNNIIPVNIQWWILQVITGTLYNKERFFYRINMRMPVFEVSENARMRMKFRARAINREHLSAHVNTFDGTYNFDGQIMFNAEPYYLKTITTYGFRNKEDISATINGEPI